MTQGIYDSDCFGWFTSCGGTLNVMVRKSTFWYDSMQGSTKNIPKMRKSVIKTAMEKI